MTVNTISIKPQSVEPLQSFSSSHLDVTKTLSSEAFSLTTMTTTTTTNVALVKSIADIIASYRIIGPGDRYDDVLEPKMLHTLRGFVAKQEPVNMVVPAYPFKSPNHESKVLGPDPDVGERMSLQHLNSIGARIQQIYPPGGHVTIVSDGLCYNDLMGVSDEEVFNYANGLHEITDSLGLKHLRFMDLFELMGCESSPNTAEEYASRTGQLKELLFASFLPAGYDFDKDIKENNNALLTYRGYIKFLDLDLATFFRDKGMSKSATRKHSSKVAREMIKRGKTFSALVAKKSPLHLRLSIHASDNSDKLSVTLLPHKRYSTFPVTPWHNIPYLDITNDSLSLGRRPTDIDVTYKMYKDELGLNFLCADVPMYRVIGDEKEVSLHQGVQLEPLYPFGLKIKVPKHTTITPSSLSNVTALAKLHSPIIFEGLNPIQHKSEIPNDLRHMANDGLSLSILHQQSPITAAISTTVSDFVHISMPKDASIASNGWARSYEEEQEGLAGRSRNAFNDQQDAECSQRQVPDFLLQAIRVNYIRATIQNPFVNFIWSISTTNSLGGESRLLEDYVDTGLSNGVEGGIAVL